ncbi:RRXRR domain-containing protein [Oscillatoriales cyanobacterium LEGE 11467]|uniref:RRXRR domain-containing protein n=1 Tax=Zarconia navalis LEGE 11467 TaxID=1828826 RepID=A0A928W232_9CYAN|nr:RRXRR domain-containing protein [Zarconia navalis]MBE9042571.1 RRXRR domain-containing protein [Zarconia navalis LEGE 11467]
MQRVPVISPDGIPLMPSKPSRARRWLRDGKAKIHQNDLNIFAIQLIKQPSGNHSQNIVAGIDPGKMFTGMAVQSAKTTLWTGHLVLPFKRVKKRMETRAMMRRTRRSRRINRNRLFNLRNHREKRFDNRWGSKLAPSIRANRELELRVFSELTNLFPIEKVVYEIVKANGSKSFSPVMVGQRWMVNQLAKSVEVETRFGWETSDTRKKVGLTKDKQDKSRQTVETHANDAIALASIPFQTRTVHYLGRTKLVDQSTANVTEAPFMVVSRLPVSRRQLHLLQFSEGGNRRKYGGTTTIHGFRKGDYVEATRAGKTYRGWVSGDTKTQVSVSNTDWKRLGQFSAKKVRLLQRSVGLIPQRICG